MPHCRLELFASAQVEQKVAGMLELDMLVGTALAVGGEDSFSTEAIAVRNCPDHRYSCHIARHCAYLIGNSDLVD